MSKKATNIVDSAVPKPDGDKRLSDEEKEALQKKELADHAHGEEREKLQQEAEASVTKANPD